MSELKLRPPSLIYEMASRPSLYPEAVPPDVHCRYEATEGMGHLAIALPLFVGLQGSETRLSV
jgi:hypothetical protein